jgi:lipopolysaccharide heptosyltransferase II
MEEHRKDVVARAPNWIGDTIMSLPSLKAIADVASSLTVVAHSRSAPLLQKLEAIDRVIAFASKRELLGISLSLRSRKLTTGIVFPRSFSSAVSLWATGAGRRIGYSGGLRDLFLTDVVRLRGDHRREHLVETYLRLARTVNPEAYYSSPELTLGASVIPGLVGVAPGATYGPAKRWRMERFLELIRRVVNECGCRVYVFGGPLEAPLESHLEATTRSRVQDFTGKTPLLETASLMAQCRVVVTNDTGLMHLAAALGRPVVALFGSTSPDWTGPLGENHSVIRKEIDCSPCYRRTCPKETYECLDRIAVEEVLESVRGYL